MSPPATTPGIEGLLRELAPQVLGVVARRYRSFADAEDAVQEALVAATRTWPTDGVPDNPRAWLLRVAMRRMADQHRRDEARRRREDLAASWSTTPADPGAARDDSLTLLFLCCHPALTPGSAIPLTLRAVGGLTTREIAAAFLVPEATMAKRITRAKATVEAALAADGVRIEPPPPEQRPAQLANVLRVLYLIGNEGYASSEGADLARGDLAVEAVRLARLLHAAVPDDPEVAGLLALLVLTDARRAARSADDGALVPLAEQDRSRWDRAAVTEGLRLLTAALGHHQVGEYQLLASIAAVHDQAITYERTDWATIAELYRRLEQTTANPVVTVNRAVAEAMVAGPTAGLDLLSGVEDRLGEHHRFLAVRAHLLEQAGDVTGAADGFRRAAARTANERERQYLVGKAAGLDDAG